MTRAFYHGVRSTVDGLKGEVGANDPARSTHLEHSVMNAGTLLDLSPPRSYHVPWLIASPKLAGHPTRQSSRLAVRRF